MPADNRLRNPYNPPESQAGDAFPGMARSYQEDAPFQVHLVEEAVADGAGSVTAAATVNLATEEGLYMVWAVDSDATTLDADGALGGGFNFAWAIVYFAANMGTPAAFVCVASDDGVAVAAGTTNDQLNFVVTSGVLTMVNQMGVAVDVYCTRIG